MITPSRATALIVTLFALVASTIAPAGAQTTEAFYLSASATALELDIAGNDIGTFAHTSATAEQTPVVSAEGVGFQGPDPQLTAGPSTAGVTSNGSTVRDPAGDGSNCGVPAIPAEVPIAALLGLINVCSSSLAGLSSNGAPAAFADATGGQIRINGTLLADIIFDLILEPLLAALTLFTDPLEESVLGPVGDALDQICDNLPPELNPIAIVEEADNAGLPIGEVIEALPGGADIIAAIGDDCLLALATQVDLIGAFVTIAEDALREAILDALDVDFVTITIGDSTAGLSSTTSTVGAHSEARAVNLETLSLLELLDALRALVADVLQGLIDDVTEIVPEQLDPVVSQIPSLADILDQVLAQLDLSAIIDDEPLLSLSLAEAVADAQAPAGTANVDTSGTSAGAVVLRISPAIAGLLGLPSEVTVGSGQSETFGEGTPLETTLQAGAVEQLSETLGSAAVPTVGARATGAQVALLTGLEGGIVFNAGVAQAQVGGTQSVQRTDELPVTGGGNELGLAVVLALLALGFLAIRRRTLATLDA